MRACVRTCTCVDKGFFFLLQTSGHASFYLIKMFFPLLLILTQIYCTPTTIITTTTPLYTLLLTPPPHLTVPATQELLLQLGQFLSGLLTQAGQNFLLIQLRKPACIWMKREYIYTTAWWGAAWTLSALHFPKIFILSAIGTLTLEDFRQVYDLAQHLMQQPKRNLQRQFKQRSKHTWLYLGPGAHHVLHTLRNR